MKKTFIFYKDWADAIEELPNEVRLEIYECIVRYATSGEIKGLKPLAQVAFNFIKKQIDRDMQEYISITERNRENGKKGGRKPKKNPENPVGYLGFEKNPTKPNETQRNPKNLDNDDDNDNDNDHQQNYNKYNFVDDDVKPSLTAQNDSDSEKEKKMIEKIKADTNWKELVAKRFQIPTSAEVEKWLETFQLDIQCREVVHRNIADAKRHFSSWLKIQIEIKNNQQNGKSDAKNRASYEVTATTAEDYTTTF